ncbi:MAG TPA: DUF1778 domain-containing protein [Acidimicrobiales bacterium]|nr:DUF1778 domain-containing protein [Acidimicrobiales bacterium]
MSTTTKSERFQLRMSPADRELLDDGAEAAGTDLSSFVLSASRVAAQRALAERTEFRLSPDEREAWEAVNAAPARALPSLRRLLDRPSPFVDG